MQRSWLVEEFKESGVAREFIAYGREEGFILGRASMIYEMVRYAAYRNFPSLLIGPELERITNLEDLEDLCLTMHKLPDAAALQARLAALLPSDWEVGNDRPHWTRVT